jgi:glycosyltransferase involved in cell wall biosynthesis
MRERGEDLAVGLALLNKNEIAALPSVLGRIDRGLFTELFVVDGGSSDGSDTMLKRRGYEVLGQFAKGRGNAFKIAMRYAKEKNLDAVCFLSTDGNEDPNDLSKFVRGLADGADVVIASRMMRSAVNEEDSSWFRPRKWGNLSFAWIAYLRWGLGRSRITDPINGYRAFTLRAWDLLEIDAEGYDVEFQTSIRSYRLGLKVVEFPTHEGRRIGGESGATALLASKAMLKTLLREERIFGKIARKSSHGN